MNLLKKPVTLIIMDGFGLSDDKNGNAVAKAKTPHLDALFSKYPTARLKCSGMAVGLPEGQMGNSEVGHVNIGAGRVVYQDYTRISKAIADGDFFKNPVLLGAFQNCREKGSAIHLVGLLSDGGVHSHIDHLRALLEMAKAQDIERLFIHCITDGRDTLPNSGAGFVKKCRDMTENIGAGRIATICGRYYAMDRDKRYDRVKTAYDALVFSKGEKHDDPVAAVESSYENGVTDEFIKPVIINGGEPIKDFDSVIFFNFRPDRMREITHALLENDADFFPRGDMPKGLYGVSFTKYDDELSSLNVAFPPEDLSNTIGEYVSKLGFSQLRLAETEKYAHVTFFLNGGVEKTFPGEDRILIPSPKVATYDMKPEMSADDVARAAIERIEKGGHDFIFMNFANCDMVGHTGDFSATVRAVEKVDECVGMVVDAVLDKGGEAIITADHGNAEKLIDDKTGSPFTAHTTNDVPICIVGAGKGVTVRNGGLSDIAPTILSLCGIPIPSEMEGRSLIG